MNLNYKAIVNITGGILIVFSICFILPAIVSLIYSEKSNAIIFFAVAVFVFLAGALLKALIKPDDTHLRIRDGFFVVSLIWILIPLIGAAPLTLSGDMPSYIDAVFESCSGFSTTGSTVLTDIEAMSQGMLFWRSFTHWLGGMGILILAIAVIPMLYSGKQNIALESTGPSFDKTSSKLSDSARQLYILYFSFTLLQIILLMFGGMNLFDSLIHAFGSAGTGGFSNYADSVGHFDSAYIDYVISIFMILFGINFNLYYFMLLGDFKELRVYLGIIATATILITLNTNQMYGSIMKAFRYALFQVSTIITTTGYATTDFNLWPTFSQCIVVLLMIIGACASSTGGGIKVSRLMIVFKGVKREIKQLVHPKSVNLIRINRKKISDETLRGVYVYLMAYALLAIVSVLIISLDNQDFTTTFTSVMATLNNIGPGLSAVGPTGNFADFSILSKIVFCIDMLAGRLEIFPFLTFLTMFAWKRKF